MDIQDTKEQRQAFEAWCIQWNIASVFPLDDEGQYSDYNIHLLYCAWLQGQAAKAQAVPDGFVLIKDDTKTVVAIERMVEQQVEASGITDDVFRLDGEKILNAAVEAQAAKAQAVPDGFVLVEVEKLNEIRDQVMTAKYASFNNDSDRIFSDIEDIQINMERLIEAQESAND